jgi:hypothetical protein
VARCVGHCFTDQLLVFDDENPFLQDKVDDPFRLVKTFIVCRIAEVSIFTIEVV